MAELINKWDVVSKLIDLENEFQQYKPFQGFEHAMYRKICEVEIAIGKTPAVEVVRCKDCKHSACNPVKLTYACRHPSGLRGFVHEGYYFCSYGERREGE